MKTQFFPRQVIPKVLLFYPLITLVIFHTKFGLIWTTTWSDENELFLNFAKNCIWRNLQNSVWKPNFLPRQAIQKILFALHFHYTGDTPYRFWFDLNNFLTRWKRPFFKINFSRNSKVPYEKQTYSYANYTKNSFCFTLSLHWLYSIPSLVWFGQLLDPIKTNYF